MRKALHYFYKEQPLAFGVFLIALVLAVFFGARFAIHAGRFHHPPHREQKIQPWMTPHFVAMSYGLPREEMQKILDIKGTRGKHPRIGDIATQMGLTIEELEEKVRSTAKAFHKTHKPPDTPPDPESRESEPEGREKP